MAITSGFFNSKNGDRKYNADQMSDKKTQLSEKEKAEIREKIKAMIERLKQKKK